MSSSNLPTLFVSDSDVSLFGKPSLVRGESYRFPSIPPSLGSQLPVLSRQVSSFRAIDEEELDDLKVLLNSVVKIFVSSVAPNFISPWTNRNPITSTGSGFIIDTKRRIIVTNAHVATHGRTILLQKGMTSFLPSFLPSFLDCFLDLDKHSPSYCFQMVVRTSFRRFCYRSLNRLI